MQISHGGPTMKDGFESKMVLAATGDGNLDDVDVAPGDPARSVGGEPFANVLERAIARRSLLMGAGAASATFVLTPALLRASTAEARGHDGDPCGDILGHATVPGNTDPDVTVPFNYEYGVILKWGDRLFPGAPAFDVPTCDVRRSDMPTCCY